MPSRRAVSQSTSRRSDASRSRSRSRSTSRSATRSPPPSSSSSSHSSSTRYQVNDKRKASTSRDSKRHSVGSGESLDRLLRLKSELRHELRKLDNHTSQVLSSQLPSRTQSVSPNKSRDSVLLVSEQHHPVQFPRLPIAARLGFELPSVPSRVERELRDRTKFVHFSELLLVNQNLDSHDRGDSSRGKLAPISSFAEWCEAFFVFMSYRAHYFPQLQHPLLKYMSIIASMANPKRQYHISQWLAYDQQFRMFARMHPDDCSIWQRTDNEIFRLTMIMPGNAVANRGNISTFGSGYTGVGYTGTGHTGYTGTGYTGPGYTGNARKCLRCHLFGHLARECPDKIAEDAIRMQSSEQLFRGRGVSDRRAVCIDFNKGNCSTPCKNKLRHMCSYCTGATHGEYSCWKLRDAGKSGNTA
ncbi:uncharacterized protein LOC129593714 isoform X2 [Paramacrobiotus metropolitanus]|uniref:uncharacterized protein LOC129593714 isoform X2 n=1 Tax=Paramacrobiotus metropolitanus TaxID=2943436 RepID=UPI002445E3F5|nr:uncharacterized protein LOC129593714 isoform X2 [Paramacrobiotus metropolitanus]